MSPIEKRNLEDLGLVVVLGRVWLMVAVVLGL